MITHVAREDRGKGVPLDDAQRVARHYGISMEEACQLLTVYSPEELLPERGYGLSTGGATIIGATVDDLEVALAAMETYLPAGGKASLELCTEAMPTEESLAEFYLQATAAGFHLSYPTARIVEGIPTTEIVLQKGSPVLLAIVPLMVPLLVIGLIAFSITRIETITKALLPILLVAVGGVIIIAGLMRRPAERAVERATAKYLPETARKKVLAAR